MQSLMIHNDGERRLLIFFCGWGSDASVARSLKFRGYDTLAVWDYRSPDFPAIPDRYEEIVVAAWSFGVAAAACFIAARPELPVTRRVAFNGTLHPVSDSLGIPEAIFSGTLSGLNERSLAKFYRRMAGCREFEAPLRPDIAALQDELRAIAALSVPQSVWDFAFISDDDRIIPPENQHRAWQGTPRRSVEGGHLPDFAALLTPLMIDKELVAKRFGSAAASYDSAASVQRSIAARLLDMAELDPEVTVEIGSGTGILTDMFLSRYSPRSLTLVDFHPRAAEGAVLAACDAEAWIARRESESVSCLLSASTMQWFNSPLGFLAHVRRVLRPGATALLSTFGPMTMRELEGIAPRLPYLDPSELTVGEVSEDIMSLSFSSPLEVLRYMRATGVNGIANDAGAALRLARRLPAGPDGRYTLTFHPLYIKITR
ncbi:MAG: DUF452 family protein [Bacteroides sp.]|nr:DUF452 family protein [Bacteroides sp.]